MEATVVDFGIVDIVVVAVLVPIVVLALLVGTDHIIFSYG